MDSFIVQLCNVYKQVPPSISKFSTIEAIDHRVVELTKEINECGLRPDIIDGSASQFQSDALTTLSATSVFTNVKELADQTLALPSVIADAASTADKCQELRSRMSSVSRVLDLPAAIERLYDDIRSMEARGGEDDAVNDAYGRLFTLVRECGVVHGRLSAMCEGGTTPTRQAFLDSMWGRMDAVIEQCVKDTEKELSSSTQNAAKVVAAISRFRQLRPGADAVREARVLLDCRLGNLTDDLQGPASGSAKAAIDAGRDTIVSTAVQADILFAPPRAGTRGALGDGPVDRHLRDAAVTPQMTLLSSWIRAVGRVTKQAVDGAVGPSEAAREAAAREVAMGRNRLAAEGVW